MVIPKAITAYHRHEAVYFDGVHCSHYCPCFIIGSRGPIEGNYVADALLVTRLLLIREATDNNIRIKEY